MHITIITPAAAGSLKGNRATATRWAAFLIELGHQVSIDVQWSGEDCDVMVALHAWRSAESIEKFKQQLPNRKLVLAMTGTDLYQFLNTHSDVTLSSIVAADKIVTLHRLAARVLPESMQYKVHVIHQSAQPLKKTSLTSSNKTFDICVVGHLREEKDSLRVAYAVRNLPAESRIRVLHYGKAHNSQWEDYAKQEMQINARYQWMGEVSHAAVQDAYAQCRLMVLPSLMEGGANVISEACIANLPVIASKIDGSVGLLGDDYAGYFPVKNENALAELLLKAESNVNFVEQLTQQCKKRAMLFTPDAEKQCWADLLNEIIIR